MSKDYVLIVEMRSGNTETVRPIDYRGGRGGLEISRGNEELRTIGVGSSVGH